MTSLLLRNATLHGAGSTDATDIRVDGATVAAVAPALARRPGEEVIDCRGGAVLPGLTDHHLHLHALAAAGTSVRCGPPAVTGRAELAAVLTAAAPDEHGWIRGTGYTESVAGDLDAAALDRLREDCPVRIQHRSGALWLLNTRALAAVGALGSGPAGHPGGELDAAGAATGRLWRADDWLRGRLPRRPLPDLAPVGRKLLRYGITAVTDATPDLAPAAITAISDALRAGCLPPRVHLLGAPLDGSLPRTPGLTAGPYKIVLADSGLPAFAELLELITAAHGSGRPVAAHCVTREALVLLIAALRETGTRAGDRIEHAAVVPPELIPDLAGLHLRVVTQPGFLTGRGDDFLRDVPAADQGDLYRGASLRRAGIPLALSSDAPYGPLDPWAVIAAAVSRRTAAGRTVTPGEQLTGAEALDAYLAPPQDPGGPPARVRAGEPASLVVLDVPAAGLPGDPGRVRAVVAGTGLRRPH